MTSRHIVDRALPQRSKLMFYFPKIGAGDDYYVVDLPFFENVSIKESKRAKYKKYSLISRSSNLYSYLGADSRQLNLSFNMTLPHLLEEHPDITLDTIESAASDKDNKEKEKERFLVPFKVKTVPDGMAFKLGTQYTKDMARDSAKQVINSLESTLSGSLNNEEREYIGNRYNLATEAITQTIQRPTSVIDALTSPFQFIRAGIEYNQNQQQKYRIIDMIIYWTNIVRSSVVNYSKNPIYGPPIIRLKHGILYQDIPCICTDYSITYNEAMGYDLDTLLPRQLKINLKLEEIRSGDFGEFMPKGNPIQRDNLAGWEAVVLGETTSMDPGYNEF